MPLAKSQPQFGKGRIVSEKITFEIPSTMKYTSNRSVSTRRPAPSMTNQKHADYHRQDDRDKLKPEMGHVARVDETNALHDTANNQDTAQEKDRSERRYDRVDQRQNAGENHQTALYKIPKRMPLDRLAHRLAHSLGGSFE